MTSNRMYVWIAIALLVTLAAAQDGSDATNSTDVSEVTTDPSTPTPTGSNSTIEPPPPPSSQAPITTQTREPLTTDAPPATEGNGTLPPITTQPPKNDGEDDLPLEPWVIVILCVAGVLICGLMVFAAKRTKAKKKDEKQRAARMEKEDKDFEKRMKNIEKL